MVLLVDNYDSFTWNLVQGLETLGAEVLVSSHDKIDSYLKTKISTKINKKKGGTLNIQFSSLKELIRIIKKIKNEQ